MNPMRSMVNFFYRLTNYFYYHLFNKRFINSYVLDLYSNNELSLLDTKSCIFIADVQMLDWIREVLFPELKGEQEYDKKYFQLIGRKDVFCILVEYDQKIIHYSFLFTNCELSPLKKISPKVLKLLKNSAFLGPAFTLPQYRGFVFPEVLSFVSNYLIKNTKIEKLVICFFQKNLGAANFYKRLGFLRVG